METNGFQSEITNDFVLSEKRAVLLRLLGQRIDKCAIILLAYPVNSVSSCPYRQLYRAQSAPVFQIHFLRGSFEKTAPSFFAAQWARAHLQCVAKLWTAFKNHQASSGTFVGPAQEEAGHGR